MINSLLRLISKTRLRQIDHFRTCGTDVQHQVFESLIRGAGSYVDASKIRNVADFQREIPIVSYDELSDSIDSVRAGYRGLLWGDSPTRYMAKSSGTTAAASKFIPITERYLQRNHYRGGKDVMFVFNDNFPGSKAFHGKSLTLGGSARIDTHTAPGMSVGDLSAILIANAPKYVNLFREPKAQIALIEDFERKVDAIYRATHSKRITSFAGVPSWNLVLMNKVLEYSGKSNICEVWPDMSLFIHGGIAFTPYRSEYERIIPSSEMRYMETYNASEGFFALQDDPSDSAMLLMLDYDVFYEFLPLDKLSDHSAAVPLDGVQVGVNYAMIISTSCGLWRYMIGDTVEFSSLNPYKIRITGRTKHFINAFGEEVIIDNAERALSAACQRTGAVISDYTAAPIFMHGKEKGAHEWVVEFSTEPCDMERFVDILDETLQSVNSDYEAKRHLSATLNRPIVRVARVGTFVDWLASKGKLGGQNKVPRLSNDRRFVEELLMNSLHTTTNIETAIIGSSNQDPL